MTKSLRYPLGISNLTFKMIFSHKITPLPIIPISVNHLPVSGTPSSCPNYLKTCMVFLFFGFFLSLSIHNYLRTHFLSVESEVQKDQIPCQVPTAISGRTGFHPRSGTLVPMFCYTIFQSYLWQLL